MTKVSIPGAAEGEPAAGQPVAVAGYDGAALVKQAQQAKSIEEMRSIGSALLARYTNN